MRMALTIPADLPARQLLHAADVGVHQRHDGTYINDRFIEPRAEAAGERLDALPAVAEHEVGERDASAEAAPLAPSVTTAVASSVKSPAAATNAAPARRCP